MTEWKGPFEEIREACERFGIDTEAGPKPVTLMPSEGGDDDD